MKNLPPKNSRGYKLLAELAELAELAAGPGTFYQICERLEIDIEDARAERKQRALFSTLLAQGHVRLDGVIFSIAPAARAAVAPPTPYVGQVAGPAYRGNPHPCTVFITSRLEGANV